MLDPRVVRQQVENLKLSYPELVNDEDWYLTLETETDLHEFMTLIVHRIDDAQALVIGTKDRFEELAARKKRFEHRIEVLRELAFKVMQSANVAKIELPEATLSLRGGQQQLVGEADPHDLPDDMCIIKREPNRSVIKELLKSGVTVPGFSLSNASPSLSLSIKIK